VNRGPADFELSVDRTDVPFLGGNVRRSSDLPSRSPGPDFPPRVSGACRLAARVGLRLLDGSKASTVAITIGLTHPWGVWSGDLR
jgi:hypothetical protein